MYCRSSFIHLVEAHGVAAADLPGGRSGRASWTNRRRCHGSYLSLHFAGNGGGRGPTRLMSPVSTFQKLRELVDAQTPQHSADPRELADRHAA